jgi:hypothetical protein
MRPDMHHLLVERGHAHRDAIRHLPKGWSARCRFRNDEDEPREADREPKRYVHFSENLSPLYRYLAAQCGRPWDQVYAEIRRHLDARSAVQLHILQHLYDRLALQVREDAEGRLWQLTSRGEVLLDGGYRNWLIAYVCPRSGLLRRLPRRRPAVRPERPRDHIAASGPDHDYRLLAGQWYEVWWGVVEQDGAAQRAILRKRQLGYQELRALGLRD